MTLSTKLNLVYYIKWHKWMRIEIFDQTINLYI